MTSSSSTPSISLSGSVLARRGENVLPPCILENSARNFFIPLSLRTDECRFGIIEGDKLLPLPGTDFCFARTRIFFLDRFPLKKHSHSFLKYSLVIITHRTLSV